MMAAINHNAGVTVVDAGLDEVERVTVVAVNGDGQLGMVLDGGVDDVFEVADVSVLAGALADLEDQRALFLGAGIDDALRDFHVVDVKGPDGETAIVSEIEHRLGGHQWHKNDPFTSHGSRHLKGSV